MTSAILIDSSVWIDHFRGTANRETAILHQLLSSPAGLSTRLLIGDLVLLEVLQGFRHDHEFERVRNLMAQLPQVSLITPELAVQSTQHYRGLRKKGITIRKTIECIIATWCIAHHVPLLFTDKDFKPFCQHLGLINYADTL